MAGRERRERSLRRRPWRLPPRKVVLIACEGEKTESIYFNGLRSEWKLTTAEVEVVGVGMTPSRVVEEAIKRKEERRNEAKRGNKVDYDEVWCVFDTDTHRDIEPTIQAARKNKINLAQSTPCFEIWYLLHFEFTTRAFQNYDELKPVLKRYISEYDKKADYTPVLLKELDAGLRNARQLRTYNGNNGTTCPATDVDLLVQLLKSIGRTS